MTGMHRRRALRLSLVALAVLVAQGARAHDPGLSMLTVQLRPDGVEALLQVGADDARALSLPQPAPEAKARLAAALGLSLDGLAQTPRAVAFSSDPDGGAEIRWQLPAVAPRRLSVRFAAFDTLPVGHKQVLRLLATDGTLLGSRLVDARSPVAEFELPAGATATGVGIRPTARELPRWVGLGASHVAEGLDHGAFLLAILLGCSQIGAVFRSVTAFTAAHSLTLALATTGWLSLSSAVVEPFVAASIVWVALRNLARPGDRGEPLPAIFALGLIHGLGFAGQLAGFGVGSGRGLLVPLFGFNLGIELAQLAAVAVALPLLTLLGRAATWRLAVVRVTSLALAVLGASWLVERLP